MPITIKIDGAEISVDSVEEAARLMRLIKAPAVAAPVNEPPPARKGRLSPPTAKPPELLLRLYVETGNRPVLASELPEYVGGRGRALPRAMGEWSQRMHLGDRDAVFKETRVGVKKGYKLTPDAFTKVKTMLAGTNGARNGEVVHK